MDDPDFEPADHAQWRQYILRKTRDPNYTHAMTRRLFERAIEWVPPVETEPLWRSHYIPLWMMYIEFERYRTRDLERVSRLYSRVLDLIPHERFSFENIWTSAVNFEIDRSNFRKAVSILEFAMEKAATNYIFRLYVDLKIQLEEGQVSDMKKCWTLFGNLDRNDPISWLTYIKFQRYLSAPDRVRFTFDQLLNIPQFSNCTDFWEFYVNFELSVGEFDRGRHFFEEFLLHKKDTKIVWFYYTKYVAAIAELLFEKEKYEDEDRKRKGKKVDYYELYVELVRYIFQRGFRHFKKSESGEIYLMKAKKNIEKKFEDLGMVNSVTAEQTCPKRGRNRYTISLG